MTMIAPPWELSQISEKARAKHDRRRTRRLLTRDRLTEHLDQSCPYCGVLITDWNGRSDWRAPSRDHRIPRSHGGRNVIENIEICCPALATWRRGRLTPEEFVSSRAEISLA
jgi:5-methylcytosine-specific restriction endonuclease McrA